MPESEPDLTPSTDRFPNADSVRTVRRTTLRSARTVSAVTLVSRLLGLLRDRAAAHLFGVSWVWDTFVLAFMVPNLFRRLFGEGSLSAAFLPTFTEVREKQGEAEAWRLLRVVAWALAFLLGGITVLVVSLALLVPSESWAALFGTADGPQADLLRVLLAILFPFVVLICINALCQAALNVHGLFGLPAAVPVVLNVTWIVGIALVAPALSDDPQVQVKAVAVGVIAGAILGLLMLLITLYRRGADLRPTLRVRHPGLRQVARRMGPTILGLGLLQVNVLLDNIIAQVMVPGDGAVSALYFGNRLLQFPLALLGIAMGVAVFPVLARHAARGEVRELRRAAADASRQTLFLTLPAMAGLLVLAKPTLAALFRTGEFGADALDRTTTVLTMYALSVVSASLIQVLSRSWFALGDTRTPMKVALAMAAVNVVGNLILVQTPLREAGVALSTAISSWGNTVILAVLLRRYLRQRASETEPPTDPPAPSLWAGMVRAMIGAGVMAGSLLASRAWWPMPDAGLLTLGGFLALAIVGGASIYALATWLMRAPELREILR